MATNFSWLKKMAVLGISWRFAMNELDEKTASTETMAKKRTQIQRTLSPRSFGLGIFCSSSSAFAFMAPVIDYV